MCVCVLRKNADAYYYFFSLISFITTTVDYIGISFTLLLDDNGPKISRTECAYILSLKWAVKNYT